MALSANDRFSAANIRAVRSRFVWCATAAFSAMTFHVFQIGGAQNLPMTVCSTVPVVRAHLKDLPSDGVTDLDALLLVGAIRDRRELTIGQLPQLPFEGGIELGQRGPNGFDRRGLRSRLSGRLEGGQQRRRAVRDRHDGVV